MASLPIGFKWRRICTVAIVLATLAVGVALRSPDAAKRQPSIVPALVHDFGTLYGDQEVQHSYRVRNESGHNWRVREIESHCGCVSASAARSVVPDGEYLELQVVLRTSGIEGSVKRRILIHLEGGGVLAADAVATILSSPVLSPSEIVISVQPDSSSGTASCTVSLPIAESTPVLTPEPSLRVSASLGATVVRGNQRHVPVTLTGKLSPNEDSWRERLRIRVGSWAVGMPDALLGVDVIVNRSCGFTASPRVLLLAGPGPIWRGRVWIDALAGRDPIVKLVPETAGTAVLADGVCAVSLTSPSVGTQLEIRSSDGNGMFVVPVLVDWTSKTR